MAFRKRTAVCTGTASLVQTLDLGAAVAKVEKLHLLSNVDTTVSVTITDATGKVIATVASADYTTITEYYLSPVEATVFDSAGEVQTANGDTSIGVIAESPLTLTAAGLDATETLTVDVFCEV